MGTTQHNNRTLDVRKDRLDLRDREYRPLLKSLPKTYPDIKNIKNIVKCYRALDMILDQKNEGKCTGYALATVINYLLWRELIKEDFSNFLKNPSEFKIKKVSERMLYNLARIYDEWDGEDYEGSSCRGAMKGWNKHGVCERKYWQIFQDQPNEGWDKEARELPLGAYYRVDKNSIADMQSAVCEVGALYVSSTIHDGWWELNDYQQEEIEDIVANVPHIKNKSFPNGGHAFVIVGYTRDGFVIQNSWGTTWGNSGFAILTYEDWLEHGMDVWVAVIGVPIDIKNVPHTFSSLSLTNKKNELIEGSPIIKKALAYKYLDKEIKLFSEDKAYQHTLILNRYGRAKHTIIYTCTLDKSIDIICNEKIKKWAREKETNRKIAIYALSGLCSEKEAISKIRVIAPYFWKNGIYPLFLTWKTSYAQEIKKSIYNFYQEMLMKGGIDRRGHTQKHYGEALNRAIEHHCQKISTRSLWTEVKKKSQRANLDDIVELKREVKSNSIKGVLSIITDSFKEIQDEFDNSFEIHAIAHSAGSQLIATTWLEKLHKKGIKLSSMHLMASTLSIEDCNNYIVNATKNGVLRKKDLYLYMMDKPMELADNFGMYRQSLLHLISRALETIHKTPLLGLEESWNVENIKIEKDVFNIRQLGNIKKWQKFAFDCNDPISSIKIFSKEDKQQKCSIDNDFIELNHENFGRSIGILENILKEIKQEPLKYRVENLC